MPAHRFFTDDILESGSYVYIRDSEHHHLAHVMRAKEGQELEIVDGKGNLAVATLSEKGRKEAKVQIQSVTTEEPSQSKIIIVQAIPRPNRLEFILEKCTELGMDEIWLFPGDKSEKKLPSSSQMKRFETITVSAMKQSGRLFLPKVSIKKHFREWGDSLSSRLYFGDVSVDAPTLLSVCEGDSIDGDRLFFIGPESGFSESEEECLKEIGAKGVKLHNNILRTDTAPMVVLSILGQL